MKLIWSPEMAAKAFIETVESCQLFKGSSVAELVSAMAAGWNARLIVETWSRGGAIATSIGLCVARNHTKGRHVCLVPDQDSMLEYTESIGRHGHSAEVMVGEPEEVMGSDLELEGIDFLVMDSCGMNELASILKVARLGHRGAVLIRKNASSRPTASWRGGVLDGEARIVRSVFLPVGKGLEITHVGARGGSAAVGKGERRWVKHVDRLTGEEIVFRK